MKQPVRLLKYLGRLLTVCVLLILQNSTNAQQLDDGMDAVVTLYGDGPNSPVAMVKRVGDPIGAGAPFDAASNNWVPPAIVPAITQWTAGNMGQVFGTTIDGAANVYFAATAMYYNVPNPPPGSNTPFYPDPQWLSYSSINAATVSQSAFHNTAKGFGLVYMATNSVLNTVNCIVTANATSAGAGLGTNKLFNTGFGIGNITYSDKYDRLYVSNLEDGKLYCIKPVSGNVEFVFDPMAPDNGINGIVPLGERIFGVAVNNEIDGTTRLYYAVLVSNMAGASQSVIRSVELSPNGDFIAATDVLEIMLPVSPPNTYFSDLAFSVRGELLASEKGDPHNAHLYQYYGRHNAWSTAQDMPVANFGTMHNSGGGADYGFIKANGTTVCDSLVWAMENAMDNATWYGTHSIPHNGFLPFTGTAFGSQAYVVDFDGVPNNGPKSRFGDIVFYDSSCMSGGPTDICGLVSAEVTKDAVGGCCYNIRISNKYHGQYFTALSVSTGYLNIDNVTAGGTWGGITYQSGQTVSFGDTSKLWYIPKDTGSTNGFFLAKICVSGTGADILKLRWIGNEPQFDTVCEKNIAIEGCGVPVDTNCVGVINQKIICTDGVLSMQFQVKNNSAFTMRSVTIFNLNPDVKAATTFVPIPDLLPGNTSAVLTVPITVKNNASQGCFFFSACDLRVFPGTSGQYPKYCCMDSIQYCVDVPKCDGCDAISITATKADSVKCCYNLNLTNNMIGTDISCLRFVGLNGAQFAVFSGWNIQAPVSSSKVTICAPGTGVSNGTYASFANFCITGTSTPPHSVSVDFLNKKGEVICTKRLEFNNCELVKPTCANILNDSLYCDGNQTKYSFSIKNNSTFPLYQVDLRLSDTTFALDKYVIIPDTPILPGLTGGPYLVVIDSSTTGNKTFCMYLTGHNNIYIKDSISATQCCTDSLGVICLPFINCDSTCCITCCEFSNLAIPNGITPNHDGYNDALVIQNATLCSGIKITVYNRWGNVVFRSNQYDNKWEGTNKDGDLLPQATYYITVELPSGNKATSFIDIRY